MQLSIPYVWSSCGPGDKEDGVSCSSDGCWSFCLHSSHYEQVWNAKSEWYFIYIPKLIPVMYQFGRRFHQCWVFTNNPWENVFTFSNLQNSSHSFLDSEFTHKTLLFIIQKITIIHFDGTIVAGMWNMLTLYILFHRGHTTPCHRGVPGVNTSLSLQDIS